MADLITLHRRAMEEFGARVLEVRENQWELPTPDTDWDVRALVNHLVYEDRWAIPLLDGRTVADVGDRFEGDLLGDDPLTAWIDAAGKAAAAVGQEGVLARTVHVSFGDISGEEYVTQLTVDHAVHAWDLARAIGADEHLDPELVELAFASLEPQIEQWRPLGVFGARVEAPAGADRQAELLALTGRQP